MLKLSKLRNEKSEAGRSMRFSSTMVLANEMRRGGLICTGRGREARKDKKRKRGEKKEMVGIMACNKAPHMESGQVLQRISHLREVEGCT